MKRPSDTSIKAALGFLLECIQQDDYEDNWRATPDLEYDINVYFDEMDIPSVSMYELVPGRFSEPEDNILDTKTDDWYTVPESEYSQDVLDAWSIAKSEQCYQPNLDAGQFERSWLPTEDITFNPSDQDSVDALMSKHGPEGIWMIAKVLQATAMADYDAAMVELNKTVYTVKG
jgi:hypothetical protein